MASTRPGPRIYNLFPRLVGSIAQWREELPRIAAMDFDWIYLNPFHFPGFSGSLYAVKDFDRLNPMFDDGSGRPQDAQLGDFLTEAHDHGLRVAMDLVVNHTAKDSVVAEQHPEWFVHEADGSLYSPRAFDPDDPDDMDKATIWGDLAELDYSPRPERDAMVDFFKKVVAHYVELGFDGFRCDAAYKVPAEVWSELIQAARAVNPETAMWAETLGCRFEEVEALQPAGFDFLFNSSKWWDFKADWAMEQYETFRHIGPSIAFPETHDTERLVTEAPAPDQAELLARQRYLFAALFSSGVMAPIGYEYGYRRKLDVVHMTPDDRETPQFDLSEHITAVNRMKAAVPALNEEGPQTLIRFENEALVGFLRRRDKGRDWCLSLVNTDLQGAHTAWADEVEGLPAGAATEVTPGREPEALDRNGALGLQPGEIRVFSHQT